MMQRSLRPTALSSARLPTRAGYTRRMTAMEGYFRQNKATAMFADGHEYEGRVDVTKITAHDFKLFF